MTSAEDGSDGLNSNSLAEKQEGKLQKATLSFSCGYDVIMQNHVYYLMLISVTTL